MLLVPTRAFFTSALTVLEQAAAGVKGPLNGAFLGLFVAPTPLPTINLVMADITEATFTGYVRQAAVWGPSYISQDGRSATDAGSVHWQPTDAVTPNTITGFFIASASTAGNLLLAGRFDTPVALADQFHLLDLVARFALDGSVSWGDGQVTC